MSLQRQATVQRGIGSGLGAPSSPPPSACPLTVLQRVLHQLIHPPPLPGPRCLTRRGPGQVFFPALDSVCGLCQRQVGARDFLCSPALGWPLHHEGGSTPPLRLKPGLHSGCGGGVSSQQSWGTGGPAKTQAGKAPLQARGRPPRARASTWPSTRRKCACTLARQRVPGEDADAPPTCAMSRPAGHNPAVAPCCS